MQSFCYLHGFRSNTHSSKVEVLQQHFSDHLIQAIAYCPHNPEEASQQLSDFIKESDRENLTVIGTSLGGFWAHWVSATFGVNAFMINPSLSPAETLPKGNFTVYGEPEKTITVTQTMLNQFDQFALEPDINNRCQVILAMDDELLDSQKALKHFADHYPVHCYPTGGHRFNHFASIMPLFFTS